MPFELKILKDYTNSKKGKYILNLKKVCCQILGKGRLLECQVKEDKPLTCLISICTICAFTHI
jgi:hypothetical protein